MIKFVVLSLALVGGSYLTFGPGRTVYSGVSVGLPIGAAQKVTPDPGSIWSFHETVTVAPGSTAVVPVLVDFDGNGVMDTEYPTLRVLVTDMQAVDSGRVDLGNRRLPASSVTLVDSQGPRWDFTPLAHAASGQDAIGTLRPNQSPVDAVDLTRGFQSVGPSREPRPEQPGDTSRDDSSDRSCRESIAGCLGLRVVEPHSSPPNARDRFLSTKLQRGRSSTCKR